MKKMKAILLCAAVCLLCTACTNPVASDTPPSEKETSTLVTEVMKPEEPTPKKITLSGNHEDIIVTETDCYVEGDRVFLFLQKGLSVPGDILTIMDQRMTDIEETTGYTFNKNYSLTYPSQFFDLYYEPGLFDNVNPNADKINILVIALEPPYVEWVSEHNAIIDINDFEYEHDLYQILTHELIHVVQNRNGVDLSPTLNEGFASYTEYHVQMDHNRPAWNAFQYFYSAEFDVELINQGESGFLAEFNGKDLNYQYGFRLLAYLTDVYGEDIYKKILDEATRQNYNCGYDPSNYEESIKEDSLQLISIIKSQTSETVFEEFKTWYQQKWPSLQEEYTNYIEPFYQE